MKKKILCLAMTALMVMGMPLTAYAEDLEGSKDWTVSFNGNELTNNFGQKEMTESMSGVMPGDSLTLQVNLENDSGKTSDWYMTNTVIKTLEENEFNPQGAAYTYILTLHEQDSDPTVLYSSDAIGGTSDIARAAGETGLHQATNNLEDHFYLTRLKAGETAYVTLYVELEGETIGNSYQNTLASLNMNFAVEGVNDEVITRDIVRTRNGVVEANEIRRLGIVQTGDNAPVVIYSALTLASGLVILVIAMKSMQRRRDEKGEQQ